jgi:prepilin-type N-terminal cleavage/methylation domain-containing protein
MAITAAHKRAQRGFTLVELLVSLAIAAIVVTGMFNLYTNLFKSSVEQDRVLQMQQNARVALDDLERDLRLAGVDVTRDDGTLPDQAVFAYAAPYEVDFNANLDNSLAGLKPTAAPDKVPASLPGGDTPFYDPSSDYPLAETIRWTLDANDDGTIDAADRQGATNPNVYRLTRQVYGYNAGTGTNGPETARAAEGVRGPDLYPDGSRPPVLFQYWIKEIDLNDNKAVDPGEDINGSGKIDFFLWGDDGGTDGLGSPLANNGVLDPPEIEALMTGNGGGPKVIDGEAAAITAATGDARATALTFAQVLSEIARVTVNVVTEAAEPDPDYVGSPHGADYPYREHVVSASASPRNALTEVTPDKSLTVSASPSDVQCPATSTIITIAMWDDTGALYTAPVDVDVTTSLGSFDASTEQPAITLTTSGGTATAVLYGEINSTTTSAVVSASTTVLSEPYSAAVVVNYIAGTPSVVTVSPDSPALPADGLSTTGVTAAVVDQCGKPTGDGSTINWTISTSPPGIGGSMNPVSASISGNTASTVLTSGLTAGIATLTATEAGSGVAGTANVNFTNCAVTITPDTASLPADGTSTAGLAIEVTDMAGTPQTGVTVNLSTGEGTLTPTSVVTDGSGKATSVLISSTTPHVAVITGSVPPTGGYCDYARGTAEVEFASCGLTIASDVDEVVPGNPGTSAVVTANVSESDTGTPLSGQDVTFSLTAADGSVNPTTDTTNGSGDATTTFTAGPTPGVATVTASSACGSGSVDIYVRDCEVSVAAEPQVIAPAAGNTSVITATLTDAVASSPMAGRQVTFSLDDPTLADFSGSTTVTTDANGEASVTIVTKGKSGTVNVTATSSCGDGTVSVVLNDWEITLESDAASIQQGNTATLTATLTESGVPTDPPAGQNTVTLTFESPGGLGSNVTPASATTSGGMMTSTFTAGSTSGNVTVRASATISGILVTDTVDLVITDPGGLDDLTLVTGSESICGYNHDQTGFRVKNQGLDNIVVDSIQITWSGGGRLRSVRTEGSVSDCSGGSYLWRYDGCGYPNYYQSSPTTLTSFCKFVYIPSGSTYAFHELNFDYVDIRGQTITVVITHHKAGGGPSKTSTITYLVPNF